MADNPVAPMDGFTAWLLQRVAQVAEGTKGISWGWIVYGRSGDAMPMRPVYIGCCLALALFAAACTREPTAKPSEVPTGAATKLEAFQGRTGIVVIRGTTEVGEVRGINAFLTVSAREYRDAATPESREAGISITVKEIEGARISRERTSYVDADEIDALVQGIDYLRKVRKDVTKHERFQAEYLTKGHLAIVVFSDARGDLKAAVTSGPMRQATVFLHEAADLGQFRELIVAARAKL